MRAIHTSGLFAWTFFSIALAASQSSAQLVYDWIATDPVSNWNIDANWDGNGLNFVPSTLEAPGSGESARINNGRTAVVDSSVDPIAGLDVNNGTLAIQTGGTLQTVVDGPGNANMTIGANGNVNLTGTGQLIVAGAATNSGNLRLTGPTTGVNLTSSFTTTGSITANITDATSHGLINVTGMATIGGTLRVNMSGFTPTIGQSWDIVTAGTLEGEFEETIVESSPILARGLQIRGGVNGNTAIAKVDNTLVLTVNRQSGETAIHNVVGGAIDITSYAIRSANGLLAPANWTELNVSNQAGTGWVDANPTMNALTELNLEGSYSIGLNGTLTLGNPYAGAAALGSQEDVVFEYSTINGEFRTGIVEYTGIPNDLTLFVDPSDGSAAIGNLSPHVTPPQVTGYSIGSAEDQLTVGTWDSFTSTGNAGTGWATANPNSSALTETNLEGSKEFTNGTLIEIGEIFTSNGTRDLTFRYTTLAGELLTGTVQYGAIPEPPTGVPGDYNEDGMVDAADYVFWRDAFGSSVPAGTGADGTSDGEVDEFDYEFWKQNFGATAGSGSGASAANVPEPSTALLAGLGLLVGVVFGRWRRV